MLIIWKFYHSKLEFISILRCRHIFIDVEWGNIIINRNNRRIFESDAPQRWTYPRLKRFHKDHQPRIKIQLLQNSHQTTKTQQSQRGQ